jgi:hypothetical protein
MKRPPVFLALLSAATLAVMARPASAASGFEGSSWTLVVAEQCQLGQIGKILLQADGTAQATAEVETATGGATSGGGAASA